METAPASLLEGKNWLLTGSTAPTETFSHLVLKNSLPNEGCAAMIARKGQASTPEEIYICPHVVSYNST